MAKFITIIRWHQRVKSAPRLPYYSILAQLCTGRGRRPIDELVMDGIVGPKTISAIRGFQQKNTRTVDGRVDPERAGGKTIVALNEFDPHPDGPPIAVPGQDAPRGFPQGGAKGRKRARRRTGTSLPIPRHFPPVPSFPGLE